MVKRTSNDKNNELQIKLHQVQEHAVVSSEIGSSPTVPLVSVLPEGHSGTRHWDPLQKAACAMPQIHDVGKSSSTHISLSSPDSKKIACTANQPQDFWTPIWRQRSTCSCRISGQVYVAPQLKHSAKGSCSTRSGARLIICCQVTASTRLTIVQINGFGSRTFQTDWASPTCCKVKRNQKFKPGHAPITCGVHILITLNIRWPPKKLTPKNEGLGDISSL